MKEERVFFFGVVVSEADLVLCFSSLVFSAVLVCFTETFVFLFSSCEPFHAHCLYKHPAKVSIFCSGKSATVAKLARQRFL